MSYAEHSDILKIMNHTHAISGSIPFVRMLTLSQGKLGYSKQYRAFCFTTFLQFFIRHETQVFDLVLSLPLQPGHTFFFLIYAWQRLQFIPRGQSMLCKLSLFLLVFLTLRLRWNCMASFLVPYYKKYDKQNRVANDEDYDESGYYKNKVRESQSKKPFDTINQQCEKNSKNCRIYVNMLCYPKGAHLFTSPQLYAAIQRVR